MVLVLPLLLVTAVRGGVRRWRLAWRDRWAALYGRPTPQWGVACARRFSPGSGDGIRTEAHQRDTAQLKNINTLNPFCVPCLCLFIYLFIHLFLPFVLWHSPLSPHSFSSLFCHFLFFPHLLATHARTHKHTCTHTHSYIYIYISLTAVHDK